ncbi:phosphatidylethanolamine-binding protein [Holotrichia oblita]|uniref:Phosphatidylethanolamine-binding protein n=1 Tax=Holotrichia oblita TaxID=644536 RepID=A0ACB9TET0_HOLOL|nr:phosphatidylethanolamine-binding protein [Holotrichia oblita]
MTCSLLMGILDKRAERLLRRNINAPNQVARLTDVKDFPLVFWLISVICVAYYSSIFPFIAQGDFKKTVYEGIQLDEKYSIFTEFLCKTIQLGPQDANTVNSMIYIVAAVTSPFFGIMIDKVGRNLTWVVLSILITALAHSILIFTYLNPYIGTITMGLGYSLLAGALWPLVALIVPEYQMGTAYGICQAIQNLGNAVMSILTGIVVKSGYFSLEMFFLGWLGIALIASMFVWILNTNQKRTLNMTPEERECAQELANQDQEKLLGDSEQDSSGEITPNSDFQIRNRYLSRIGAPTMQEEGLIPDVIDTAPGEVLHVTYSGGEKVHFGHELTPTQVKDPPTVQWTANQDAYYTLAMVDPDAPSRENPTFREVNHWLIGNIHGSDLESGDVITEYLGSGPPKGTGLHRYIFLVFKQSKKLQFDEPKTAKLSRAHRLNFNLRKFVKKYSLGDPIAGNFYKAQWDPYVDERVKMISNN